MTSISRIVKIGDTDISSYVEWGPHRTKGAGRRVKTSPIIGGNRAVVWQEGRDPLTLEAGLIFRPDLADQIGDEDEITALIDDLAGDQETDRLYFGRADRFAVVHGSVGDTEIAPAAGGAGIIRKTAKFWADASELYADDADEWDVVEVFFPYTQTTGFSNLGNIESGLYALEIDAGAGLDNLAMSFLLGATTMSTIAISPHLMEDELLVIDRFGQITQTYADAFTVNKFSEDKYASASATVSGGKLVITTSGYAAYQLDGHWPLVAGGLVVTFTPTETGTGEAFLEASVDGGGSWLEVSKNSRWVDGAENKIYVPQAEGHVEVLIRWRCDSGITSVAIDDLEIHQERYVSSSLVPKIPVGATYKVSLAAEEDADSYIDLSTEAGDNIITENSDTLYWPYNPNLSILATWRNRYNP